MSEIAVNALLNFGTLLICTAALIGSALLCMFISDRAVGNPLAGLGAWALALMVLCSIAKAMP